MAIHFYSYFTAGREFLTSEPRESISPDARPEENFENYSRRQALYCIKTLSNIHASGTDLERYYLGMVRDATELAALETHLLGCLMCVERAEANQEYVDMVRVALTRLAEPGMAQHP